MLGLSGLSEGQGPLFIQMPGCYPARDPITIDFNHFPMESGCAWEQVAASFTQRAIR